MSKFELVSGSADAYSGIADCVKKTIRNEGFPALYKGILPPIFAETPKRAIKFFCFGSYNAYLSRNTSLSNPMCGSIAGLGSGLTEGLFITPFERVKILLQNSKGSLKGSVFVIKNTDSKLFLPNDVFRGSFSIRSNEGSYRNTWFR